MDAPENHINLGRVLSAILLFVVGFVATAALLHLAIVGMRDPLHLHADVRSEKLLMLDRWHGSISSAVFGSSHVHNGFDPRVFDQVLAGTPESTHIVNLAIEGGSQSEQRAMALTYMKNLSLPPGSAHACLTIMELNAGANFTSDHLIHPRAINIYDWPTTRFVSHFVNPQMGLKQRVGRVGFAYMAMALHEMSVGMLSNLIFAPPIDQELLGDETQNDRRGVKLMPVNLANIERIRKEMESSPKIGTSEPGEITPGSAELIEQLSAASPTPNMAFAFLVMPKIDDLTDVASYPESIQIGGRTVPIINLAKPAKFPQLYRPELWFDPGHLNKDGAVIASTLIAQELKLWYATHGAPSACGG